MEGELGICVELADRPPLSARAFLDVLREDVHPGVAQAGDGRTSRHSDGGELGMQLLSDVLALAARAYVGDLVQLPDGTGWQQRLGAHTRLFEPAQHVRRKPDRAFPYIRYSSPLC